jgi:hypothetical protein
MENLKMSKSTAHYLAPATLLLALLAAGCGSSSKTTTPVVPVPPASSVVNTYVGTQNSGVDVASIVSYGGVWDLTLNTQLKQFSTDDISNLPSVNSGSAISGTIAAASGFVALTPENNPSLSGGYALAIPGEAAMLRPGYNGETPAIMAAQNDCLGVAPAAQFNFVSLPNVNWTTANPAYGSLQATSTGTAWTFAGATESLLGGASGGTLAIPAGYCLEAQEGYVISVAPQPATNHETYTIAIGPTGYFSADLGAGNQNNPGPSGLVGVLQPSSAIATSALTGSTFRGFYYEPLNGAAVTQPVAFGQGKHTAASITGGVYATDDPTTTPNADTSIQFGAQSSSTNGLFPNATVVVPDPNAVCTGSAITTTPSGVQGCILPAAAVVGYANKRYSVFLIAWDTTNATPLGIYLYAQ